MINSFSKRHIGPNESEKSRLAFSVHYVEGEYEWLKDNWLQRPESFPFSSL